MAFIERSAEGKKIIWSENSNRYLLLEEPALEVMRRLIAGISHIEIVQWCMESYGLLHQEGNRFVGEVRDTLMEFNAAESYASRELSQTAIVGADRFVEAKVYQISDLLIRVEYENYRIKTLIHPRFAHLEVENPIPASIVFSVFQQNSDLLLARNHSVVGQFNQDEEHVLVGRFFLELLNLLYRKKEEDWMAVWHASCLDNGQEAILFAGESGKGKSTLSALMVANGYHLLADDLVPVDTQERHVFGFPAALSVKAKALDLLTPLFPQLTTATEYHDPDRNRSFRYLAPEGDEGFSAGSLPCKAAVFVEYQEGSGLTCETLPKDKAFEALIPDSWISPVPANVEIFLDWFLAMPTYKITYSDTDLMIQTVTRLFEDETV